MVIVDNNILSSLAKIDRLDLLKKLFRNVKTVPAVINEFRDEAILGYDFVENIEDVKTYSKRNKKWLLVVSLTTEENSQKEELANEEIGIPHTDAECLSVALNRDEVLLTDDSRLGTVANQKGIDVYDLETFLLAIAKRGIISKPDEGKKIIEKIEEKDFYTFSESFKKNIYKEIV